jgi:hypothetical protein
MNRCKLFVAATLVSLMALSVAAGGPNAQGTTAPAP